MADLTSTLSELLSPDQLQKLLQTRDNIPYVQDAATPAAAPAVADGSSNVIADMSNKQSMYDSLFGQNMQGQLAPTLSGKSAADSADVLANVPDAPKDIMSSINPAAEGMAPAAEAPSWLEKARTALSSLRGGAASEEGAGVGGDLAADAVGAAGDVAGAAALPAAVAYAALKSTPANADEDTFMKQKLVAYAKEHGQPIPSLASDATMPLPNGGLQGAALDAYIAQHPGPQATTGFNPSAASDDSEDDDSGKMVPTKLAARGPAQSRGPAGAAPTDASATATQAPSTDPLQALIDRLYSPDLQKAALESQGNMQFLGNMSKAGAMAASALSRGATAMNAPVSDEILKNSNQMLENLTDRQKMLLGQMQTGMQLSDLRDKEQMRNPGSPVSQAYRAAALSIEPNLAKVPGFANMDAEGIKQLQPMVDMAIKKDMVQAQRAFAMQFKMDQTANRAKADVANKIGMVLQRGANQRALDADRRVDNIMSLINGVDPATGKSVDINKLSPEQAQAASQEMEQIFRGGMAVEGNHGRLIPSTAQSYLASLTEKATGTPTPANVGPLIKQFAPYLGDIQRNARAFVGDQIKPMLVGSNRMLRQDDMSELQNTYGKYLSPIAERDAAMKAGAAPSAAGMTVKINGIPHMVPPGTDLNKVKQLVLSNGGTFEQ